MKHVSGVAAASWLTLVGVTMSCGGDTPPRPVEQVRLGVRYGPHTVIGPFLCDTKRHGQDCAEMDVGKAGVGNVVVVSTIHSCSAASGCRWRNLIRRHGEQT